MFRGVAAAELVKVFILAKQSNLEGKAKMALLESQVAQSAPRPLFAHFQKDPKWIERDDLWIKFLERKEPLKPAMARPSALGRSCNSAGRWGTVMRSRSC